MTGSFAKPEAGASIEKSAEGSILRCNGAWTLPGIVALERQMKRLSFPTTEPLILDCSGMTTLDTAGALLLCRTLQHASKESRVELRGLRPGHDALLRLIQKCSIEQGAPGAPRKGMLERLGHLVWNHLQQILGIVFFLGESAVALQRSLVRPSRIRWRAILYNLQIAGFNALPIVGLLSFLIGVVISYQGATQLARYGANIFVADLVGFSILREMAPLLTAIIVAGRSGSAYAAQIGTMKVTEEFDALHTTGVSPMDLLVLPKILALVVALPLLTVYADILGVLGGMVMAKAQLDVGYMEFLDRFDDAVKVSAYLVGIGKAPVFAVIIAIVGCFQGFQVGGSADSVGRQTTASVVQAIFLVIICDALFSVIFSWLGI